MKKAKIYRITIVEDSTHRRLKSWRFNSAGAVLFAVTFLVVEVGLLFGLLTLTPLRTVIPGYPDAHSRKIAVENAIRIDSLENVINRWELYSENLRSVLLGEPVQSIDSIIKVSGTKYLTEIGEEEAARHDAALREKLATSGDAKAKSSRSRDAEDLPEKEWEEAQQDGK